MEKKDLTLKDVEDFMGIPAKDFISENAKKIHPSFDGFDKLILAATAASAVQFGEPNHHRRRQDSKEKFFKRLEYKPDPNETIIPKTTPPQQLFLKTKRLLQDNKKAAKRSLKFDDDHDYQEKEKTKRSNKRPKRTAGGGGNKRRVSGPAPAPAALTPEVEKLIQESGADANPVVVIRKELTESDVNPHQNRMLVPVNQMTTGRFLMNEEEEKLKERYPDGKKKVIEVPIIMPSLKRGVILLRRWDMGKDNGKASVNYLLSGDWRKLMEYEGLKANMEIQLWAYRVDKKLRFALVNLANPNPNPNPNGGSSSSIPSTSSQ